MDGVVVDMSTLGVLLESFVGWIGVGRNNVLCISQYQCRTGHRRRWGEADARERG